MIEGKFLYLFDDLKDIIYLKKRKNPCLEIEQSDLEDRIYAVVYAEGQAVAMGELFLKEQNYYIDNIFVLEEKRKKGYGDFVARILIDKASIMGAKEVFTIIEQECELFYKKLGFLEEVQEKKLFKLLIKDLCKKCGNIK